MKRLRITAPSGLVFRQFTKTIEVTSGRLYFTNYESLTMVASFADRALPEKHQAAKDEPGFEVIANPAEKRIQMAGINWWKM